MPRVQDEKRGFILSVNDVELKEMFPEAIFRIDHGKPKHHAVVGVSKPFQRTGRVFRDAVQPQEDFNEHRVRQTPEAIFCRTEERTSTR